eukprot:12919161-Prorocentrum_lima.AAC.1
MLSACLRACQDPGRLELLCPLDGVAGFACPSCCGGGGPCDASCLPCRAFLALPYVVGCGVGAAASPCEEVRMFFHLPCNIQELFSKSA